MPDAQDYNELEIQALGRPCVLGQLYNATTSKFLNEHLFYTDKIKPGTTTTSHHTEDTEFKEVKSLEDRAKSLNVSASLAVSIMGGAVDISGYGSYIDRNEDTTNSHTVSMVYRGRTRKEHLNIQSMQDAVAMKDDDIKLTEATHIVTAITYGGNAVGTFTEKVSKRLTGTEIGGSFKLKVSKELAKAFSAEGEAKLDQKDRAEMNSRNLEVRLIAEFMNDQDEAPTNAVDLIYAVKKAKAKIGDGVPCDIVLTPLSRFGKGSVSSRFRELAEAELKDIISFYDKVVDLNGARAYLFSYHKTEHHSLFPSFIARCDKRSIAVNKLLQKARKELAEYLVAYRSTNENKSAKTFLADKREDFDKEWREYNADLAESNALQAKFDAADKHKFPLISASKLRAEMDRDVKGAVALIIVPETIRTVDLLNTYVVLANDIHKWHTTEDAKRSKNTAGEPVKTVYHSIYADPKCEKDFLTLDDIKNTIQTAIEAARKQNEVAFLTWGLSKAKSGGLEWNTLNQEGWGIIINEPERWRYIGEVHKGLQHGTGVTTYGNGSVYSGGWFNGQREGHGELFAGKVSVEKGVYLDNSFANDGIVLRATILRDSAPINFANVTLRLYESVSSHVSRIARIFGWELGQKFDVQLVSTTGAFTLAPFKVNGKNIDPSEDSDLAYSSWPLDANGEKEITIVTDQPKVAP